MLAIYAQNLPIVELLLAAGANPNCMDEDSRTTPLLYTAKLGLHDFVSALLAKGKNYRNFLRKLKGKN